MVAKVLVVAVVVSLLSGVCFGQEETKAPPKTVSISGRVKDPTGAGVRDAAVTLSVPGQFSPAAKIYTHQDGTFAFSAVPPRKYLLLVQVPGFKIFREAIDAESGKDIDMGDLHVELGGIGDPVEVDIPKYPKEKLAQFVIDKLDVTSFGNSIGPRRETGKTSFKDYGVVPRSVKENEAQLEEADGLWNFYVTILKRTNSGIYICFEDRGAFPSTYHTVGPLLLTRPDSKSLLKAAETKTAFKNCPVFAK